MKFRDGSTVFITLSHYSSRLGTCVGRGLVFLLSARPYWMTAPFCSISGRVPSSSLHSVTSNLSSSPSSFKEGCFPASGEVHPTVLWPGSEGFCPTHQYCPVPSTKHYQHCMGPASLPFSWKEALFTENEGHTRGYDFQFLHTSLYCCYTGCKAATLSV